MNLMQTINGLDILFIIITFVISFRAGLNWEKAKWEAAKKRNARFIRFVDGESIEAQMAHDGWKYPMEQRQIKRIK